MEVNRSAHDARSSTTTVSPRSANTDSPTETPRSEDLFVRNYDIQRTYHLELTASQGDETSLQREYTLQPGQVIAEFGVLSPGEYEIEITIDHTGTVGQCSIGADPATTALVEVGNGTVTLSQGLY